MSNNLSVNLSVYPHLNENLWNKIGLFGLDSIFYEYTANPFIEHTLFCSNSTNILDYDQTPTSDFTIQERIFCKNCNITLDQTNITLHPIEDKLTTISSWKELEEKSNLPKKVIEYSKRSFKRLDINLFSKENPNNKRGSK